MLRVGTVSVPLRGVFKLDPGTYFGPIPASVGSKRDVTAVSGGSETTDDRAHDLGK